MGKNNIKINVTDTGYSKICFIYIHYMTNTALDELLPWGFHKKYD